METPIEISNGKSNPRSVFVPRLAAKPFEYPEVVGYKKAIHNSFWTVDEWNFVGDLHDFKVTLNDQERNVVRNALLAISQIEVEVKEFWARTGDRFPKEEFKQVGAAFADSEVRHFDAYSHLLEVMGLNDAFNDLDKVPAIQGRIKYLKRYLTGAKTAPHEKYASILTLFSLFVENVSLFSQFAIVKSFNKHKNILKDIDNVIQATQKEEQVHALFGAFLVNQIRQEFPEWFDADFYAQIKQAAEEAYEAESKIIDWIFEQGDLSFIDAATVKEFVKQRINESLELIGAEPVYEVDNNLLSSLHWFKVELKSTVNADFFYKRPTTYTKKQKPITAKDLF